MHSAIPMQIAKIGHIVLSALLVGLAILILLNPQFPLSVFETACGIFLILFGAVKITGYASKDLYRLAFQYDFVYGFVLAGVGLVFLLRPDLSVETLGTVIGLFVFSDGVIKIQVARHAKKFGITLWWMIFAFAMLASLGGLFVAIYRFGTVPALEITMGVIFLIEGLMNICTVLTSVRVVEYREPGPGNFF